MRYVIYLVVVLLVFAGAVRAVNKWESNIEQRGYDRCKAEWSAAKAEEQQLARIEENRTQTEKVRIENANKLELQKAETIALNERTAADQLRVRIRTLATSTRSAAASNTGIVFGSSAVERIAAVAGESVAEYQELAEAARRAHLAGKTCERSYDSLTMPLSTAINDKPTTTNSVSAWRENLNKLRGSLRKKTD